MATAQANKTFTDGLAFDANPVNSNFTALKNFANNSLMLLDGTKDFTADLNMGGYKVTNLAAPSAATDLATKSYFDNLVIFDSNEYSCPAETPVLVGSYSGTLFYEGRCTGMVEDSADLDITMTPGSTSGVATGATFTFNETGQYLINWRWDDAVPADPILWGSIYTFGSAGDLYVGSNGGDFDFVNTNTYFGLTFKGYYSTGGGGTAPGASLSGILCVVQSGCTLNADPQTQTPNTYPSRQYTSTCKIMKIGEI